MWALIIGIRIAQNMSLPKVIFEMDSKVIVNMVTSRHTNNAYLSPILGEIIDLLQHPNRETSITHVYREANRFADFLANRGHSSSFDGDIVNLACHSLQLILYDDFMGASLPRLIR
ncbi:heat shock 70 kDa protein [Trifolium repens]|nr:heat shock 70 kDa protein [Trifolium repens]